MNENLFKEICGNYATGVTVITSFNNNINYGFTANSFTSVSISPFLILFCLNKKANSNKALNIGNHFVVNILSSSQSNICNQFANNNLSPSERFSEVKTTSTKNDIKIISDSVGWLECKVKNIVDGGDHYVYIGEAEMGNLSENQNPLIYHNSKIKKII